MTFIMQQTFTHNIAVAKRRCKILKVAQQYPTPTIMQIKCILFQGHPHHGKWKLDFTTMEILLLHTANPNIFANFNRTLMPPTFQVNEFTFIFMGRDWPINQAIMCSFEVIVAFTTYNSRGRFEVIPRPLRIWGRKVRSSDMVGQNGRWCRLRNARTSITPAILLAYKIKNRDDFAV